MEDRANRIERVIAGARLILALSAICLVFVYPEFSIRGGSATYSVLAWYFFYDLTVVWVADRSLISVRSLGFYTQAIDTLWFPVILICTQGENSPFFLYYVFSLITASSRWGFNQTLFVNTANVGMYLIVHLMTTSAAEFGFFKFWARPTYLYVLACLIGYLGEHQKRAQNQLLSLAELSSSIRVNHRLSEMLNELINRVRKLFEAEQCILVYRDE